ncbi:MAG: Acylphosphate phosphohydrolase, partial [uncultured Solirubrobacteraceae bacterium]
VVRPGSDERSHPSSRDRLRSRPGSLLPGLDAARGAQAGRRRLGPQRRRRHRRGGLRGPAVLGGGAAGLLPARSRSRARRPARRGRDAAARGPDRLRGPL